jgi:hypothetical protein
MNLVSGIAENMQSDIEDGSIERMHFFAGDRHSRWG